MKVLVRTEWKPQNADSGVLRTLAAQALRATAVQVEAPADAEVSVLFVSDERMAELNEAWRRREGPTDVLSFAMNEGESMAASPEAGALLGDIVVSLQTAQAQADAAGRSLREEVATLLVHGFLHLLGHDHPESPGTASEMERLQTQCIEHLRMRAIL